MKPSVETSVASILGRRDALATALPGLKFAQRGLFGADGQGTTDDSFVLLDFDESSMALLGLESVAPGIEKFAGRQVDLLETKISLKGALDTWSKSIDTALDASTSGARIARIAEVLPGLGSTFRRANIDELLKQAANISKEFKSEIARIDTAYTESLDAWRKVEDLAETASHAIPVIGLAVSAMQYIENGLRTADWSPRVFAASAASANVAKDDPRLENAIGAFAARLERTAEPVTAGQAQIQGIIDAVATATDTAAGRFQGLQATVDRIEGLIAEINKLPAAIKPFNSVLGAMTAPFDAIFDFLENPPKVFRVPIFPSISRNNIDKIVSFLGGISDYIFGFFDPILDPILEPVTDAVNKVFDTLNPIKGFVAPMDTLDKLMAELFDAVKLLDGILDPILAAADLIDIPAFVEEIERPGDGETRATYSGGDKRDVVVGRAADPGEGLGVDGAVLSGGGGNDRLTGTALDDLLVGGDGNDLLRGLGDADVMFGHAGDDLMFGDDGDDIVAGNAGNDTMAGGAGADSIGGGAGDDNLTGGSEDDTLLGGSGGNDILLGGSGADTLRGDRGDDILVGGDGSDTFVFASIDDGFDRIRGYDQGFDKIEIEGHDFDDLIILARNGHTFIDYGDGDEIMLVGFDGTLGASDFL